jgi:hypothetical protein
MARRCDTVKIPQYYKGELRSPAHQPTGYITAEQMAWDMSGHWRTASEWIAWIRRKDGMPKYWGRAKGWHYPMRPEVAAHCYPMSNMKRRVLP